jgi:hypothetical protein
VWEASPTCSKRRQQTPTETAATTKSHFAPDFGATRVEIVGELGRPGGRVASGPVTVIGGRAPGSTWDSITLGTDANASTFHTL